MGEVPLHLSLPPVNGRGHPFVSSIILTGRVLCKVTPAMPTWGLSPDHLYGFA